MAFVTGMYLSTVEAIEAEKMSDTEWPKGATTIVLCYGSFIV
jgi:hypothetical protein